MITICTAPLWSARYRLGAGGHTCGDALVKMRMGTVLNMEGIRLDVVVVVHLSKEAEDQRASEALRSALLSMFGNVQVISMTELMAGVTCNPWTIRGDVESCVREALRTIGISSFEMPTYLSRKVEEADVERFVKKAPHLLMIARSMAPIPETQDDSFYCVEDIPWSIFHDAEVIQNLMTWCRADRAQYDAVLSALTQGDPAKRSWVKAGTP